MIIKGKNMRTSISYFLHYSVLFNLKKILLLSDKSKDFKKQKGKSMTCDIIEVIISYFIVRSQRKKITWKK